jgi:hypothetical protein
MRGKSAMDEKFIFCCTAIVKVRFPCVLKYGYLHAILLCLALKAMF